jgi:hypothetical protein
VTKDHRVCGAVRGQPLQLRPVACEIPRNGKVGLVGVGKCVRHQSVGPVEVVDLGSHIAPIRREFCRRESHDTPRWARQASALQLRGQDVGDRILRAGLPPVGIGAVSFGGQWLQFDCARQVCLGPFKIARGLTQLPTLGQKRCIVGGPAQSLGQYFNSGLHSPRLSQGRRERLAQCAQPLSLHRSLCGRAERRPRGISLPKRGLGHGERNTHVKRSIGGLQHLDRVLVPARVAQQPCAQHHHIRKPAFGFGLCQSGKCRFRPPRARIGPTKIDKILRVPRCAA